MLRVLGWLIHIGEALMVANLLLLLVAAICMRLRHPATEFLRVSVWFWAFTTTAWCSTQVYMGWGLFLTIVGLALGIVGIVPVAALCFLFVRDWTSLADLIFQAVLIFGGYTIAFRMTGKKNEAQPHKETVQEHGLKPAIKRVRL